MKDLLISTKNRIFAFLYKNIAKPVFFKFDPEFIHDRILFLGKILGSNFITRFVTKILFSYSNKKLEQTRLNIKFKNPVGLAAGFDKNAELTQIIPEVGFGFEEVGSITGEFCEGNPKPRLWRVPEFNSLRVNYGLKNNGCEKIYNKLKNKKFKTPIFTSIAKTNCKETAEIKAGIKDYVKAYQTLSTIGNITVINISCPNAFGGQPFHDKEKLDLLLKEIKKIKSNKPILLKLSSDLTEKQLDDIIIIATKHKIAGFICSNLTKDFNQSTNLPGKGGLSGKLVEELSNKQIKYIYKKAKGKFIIVGLGGIFTAEDAYKKIKLGASLVQLVTGMIFQGPQVIGQINQGLVKLLEKDGYKNISEAIGADNR